MSPILQVSLKPRPPRSSSGSSTTRTMPTSASRTAGRRSCEPTLAAWAAAFGNGYNNTVADGHASTTGNAVLYIVNIATGAVDQEDRHRCRHWRMTPPAATGRTACRRPCSSTSTATATSTLRMPATCSETCGSSICPRRIPASWSVANGGAAVRGHGCGWHCQPITSRPNVSRGPRGVGLIVAVRYRQVPGIDGRRY